MIAIMMVLVTIWMIGRRVALLAKVMMHVDMQPAMVSVHNQVDVARILISVAVVMHRHVQP
jgi:hypothetical protein